MYRWERMFVLVNIVVLAALVSWPSALYAGEKHIPRVGTDVSVCGRVQALGQTRRRLQHAYDRLCSPPLDDLEFVLADVHFHKKRRFTRYSGDISGRMLGALMAAASVLGCDCPMAKKLAAALPQYQKADGHFGEPQNLEKSITQQRDMPILWGNGRLLPAMAEWCAKHPSDTQLLKTATRLGEYVIATRPYYGREENFTRVGGQQASGFTTCYPSFCDGLVALGQLTGEKRFYENARFIGKLSLLDKQFQGHHSHGRLVTYRGLLDLDRFTGTNEFLSVVTAGSEYIRQKYLFPTGGVPEILNQSYPRDEGCSEADWIRVNFLLWRATGNAAYLDAAECIIRNHLLATQCSNGGFGHTTFKALRWKNHSYRAGRMANTISEAYWCCSMHCTQLLADAANWAVLQSRNAVAVTWLAEARTIVNIDQRDVIVTTEKTSPFAWKVQLECLSPMPVTLLFRVPGWANHITVNGQIHYPKNTWLKVTAQAPGTMQIVLPAHTRLVQPYQDLPPQNGCARIFSGPDLFCLPDVYLRDKLLKDDAVPTVVLAAEQPTQGSMPVVVQGPNGAAQKAQLVAVSQRPPGGCRLLFNVRKTDQKDFEQLARQAEPMPERGTAVELMFACDGQYQLYLNDQKIFTHAGWQESPRVTVYTNRRDNVLTVMANGHTQSEQTCRGLIGVIRAGEQTYYTCSQGWSVRRSQQISGEWLVEAADKAQTAVKIEDLGGFGAAPWYYIPGHFAGTPARWIWPKKSQRADDHRFWLFRYSFRL